MARRYPLLIIAVLAAVVLEVAGLLTVTRSLCYSAPAFLVSALLLYGLYRACAAGWKLWKAWRDSFGPQPVQRLIGFGLACLLFEQAFTDLVRSLIGALFELAFRVPARLVHVAASRSAPWSTWAEELEAVLADTVMLLSMGVEHAFVIFSNAGKSIPGFFALLATWGIIGSLLQPGSGVNSRRERSRIAVYVTNLMLEHRRSLLFASILLLSGFTSLSALVAIPFVKDWVEDKTYTPEKLEKDLGDAIRFKALDSQLNERLTHEDPLADLQRPSASSRVSGAGDGGVAEASTFSLQFSQAQWDHIEELVWKQQRQRKTQLKELDDLKQQMSREREQSLQALRATIQRTAALNGDPKDANRHYLLLLDWYQRGNNMWGKALQDCGRVVRGFDDDLQAWRSSMLTAIKEGTHEWGKEPLPVRCWEPELDAIPERPDPNKKLVWIFSVARWLVNTESMDLVLICGMLGFGLFGAAISRFVRTPPEVVQPEVLRRNMGHAVLNGFSAAVVVFLAARGGLATFLGTSSDLKDNSPYSLLLICLIAAVFSDSVWELARNRFAKGDTPGSQESTGGQKEGTQGPAVPSLPHPVVQTPTKEIAQPPQPTE